MEKFHPTLIMKYYMVPIMMTHLYLIVIESIILLIPFQKSILEVETIKSSLIRIAH